LNWPVAQTYATSLWEIAAHVEGYNRANDPDAVSAPTDEEFAAAKRFHGFA